MEVAQVVAQDGPSQSLPVGQVSLECSLPETFSNCFS